MTHSRFILAASIGFLAMGPALANDAPGGASRLASLQDIGSARALFLKPADVPTAEVQRSRVTSLTVTFTAQVPANGAPEPQPTPVKALALPIDGARPGGTNLYGFTRDPRATTTTPAGVRLADPRLVQTVKPAFAPQRLGQLK